MEYAGFLAVDGNTSLHTLSVTLVSPLRAGAIAFTVPGLIVAFEGSTPGVSEAFSINYGASVLGLHPAALPSAARTRTPSL